MYFCDPENAYFSYANLTKLTSLIRSYPHEVVLMKIYQLLAKEFLD